MGTSRKRRTLPKKARPGWLTKMDQRSAVARALQDSLLAVGDQLGGNENLTPIARMLVTRLIHSDALAQQIEDNARQGKAIDVGQYLAVTDRIVRVAIALGIERRTKPMPSPLDYAASIATGDAP